MSDTPTSDRTPRTTEFGELVVGFDDGVLVPRAWTTAQSYWAADLLRGSGPGPVLELCAGVGHIGLLAVAGTDRLLVLVDLDPNACEHARANAASVRPEDACEVRHGRVDEVLGEGERFAGVIADPPWVPSDDVHRFPDDPLTAIDGGADGMQVAWSCLEAAAAHLDDGGWLLLQLGTTAQADAVRGRVVSDPGLALEVAEVREYGDRGVLVHLRRTTG